MNIFKNIDLKKCIWKYEECQVVVGGDCSIHPFEIVTSNFLWHVHANDEVGGGSQGVKYSAV